MEGEQTGLVRLVSICLCTPCPSQQQVSWLGFSFPPCLLCFLDLSWLHRSLHRVELMGPAVRPGIEEPRSALQPGCGPRASPPQASTTGAESTTGAAAPAVPPAVGAWWAHPRLCGLSPGEKLRSQSGQLKIGRSGLGAERAGVPDPQGPTG